MKIEPSSSNPTTEKLMDALTSGPQPPKESGTVDMIVARPIEDERVVLDIARVGVGEGLIGDNYLARGSTKTEDGKADPEAQLNLMMSWALDAVSDGEHDRWELAGDQFIVDFDLSESNLPVGSRLRIGDAVIEVSKKPHRGCAKFAARFGTDSLRWVNHDQSLRLRGINATVVTDGTIRLGDAIVKLD